MTEHSRGQTVRLKALRFAFPRTIPIMAGFLFLGITYGIYMRSLGFPASYPACMAVTIFAGSMEFVAGELLLQPFNPVNAFLMTLMINARHLFYGLSMLERYRSAGKKRFYLIYGMCDESFSINCSAQIPDDVNRSWFWFFVTLLNHCYWVTGAALGGIFGELIHFNTKGLDFVMTALFVVIFLDNWLKERDHTSSLIGLGVSLLALLLFGTDRFMIPAMGVMLAIILAGYQNRAVKGDLHL